MFIHKDWHYHVYFIFAFEGKGIFPGWLQLLICCSCFVDNFTIQSSAISTMLDLIGLTQSVAKDAGNKDSGPAEELDLPDDTQEHKRSSVSMGTVSVVIVPSLSPQHLAYLNGHTHFYKVKL